VFDGGEDIVGRFGSAEGPEIGILLFDKAADCGMERVEATVDAAPDLSIASGDQAWRMTSPSPNALRAAKL
jgi:hypothetical protein